MRYVVLFLIGLIIGACHPAPPIAPQHIESAAVLKERTVALVEPDRDGDLRAYCSGVWVSDTSILTAYHCVADLELGGGLAYVVAEDVKRGHGGVLYAFDEAHDLALVRALVPPEGHGYAVLRQAGVEQGMAAQAMGHSLGLWYSYSSGDIAAVRALDIGEGLALWVQTTTPVSPGNSGGGLFDSDNRLMGVCHGSFTRGQSLNLFVHPVYIEALFSAVRKESTL